MTARRPSGGFTLVEVVAALALSSLVLLTLAGVHFTLHRSLAVLTSTDGQARKRAVYRRLRADLETAYASPNVALPPFTGEPDRLSFLIRLGPTGLSQVEYAPGTEAVERRVKPWTPGEEHSVSRSTPLLEPGQRLRFRYLSRAGGWSSRWSGEAEGGPPAAVEVTLEPARPGRPAAEESWVIPVPVGGPPPGESL